MGTSIDDLPDGFVVQSQDELPEGFSVVSQGAKNGTPAPYNLAKGIAYPFGELARGVAGAPASVFDLGTHLPTWAYNTFRPDSMPAVDYPPSLNSAIQGQLDKILPGPQAGDFSSAHLLQAAPFGVGGMLTAGAGQALNDVNPGGNKNIQIGSRDIGVSPNDVATGLMGMASQGALSPKPALMGGIKESVPGKLSGKLAANDIPTYLNDVIPQDSAWGKIFGYTDNLPFSGRGGRESQQALASTSAALKTIGEDGHELTPEVMKNADSRISNGFESFGKNNDISSQAGSNLINEVNTLKKGKWATFGEDVQKRLAAQVKNNLSTKFNSDYTMDGKDWGSAQRSFGADARSTSDSDYANGLYDLQNATRNAMRKSITPDQWKPFDTLNNQYRSMLALEPAAKKAIGTGTIDPTALQTGVNKIYPNYVYDDPNALPQLTQGMQLLKNQKSTPVTDLYKYGWAGDVPQAALMAASPVLGPLNRMLNTQITPLDRAHPYGAAFGRLMQGGSIPFSFYNQGQ